jgi:hypothetical protein
MRAFLWILLFSLALACGLCIWFVISRGTDANGDWVWVVLYQSALRAPLFTGCLTVGSFLLTLKATIIMRIKEIYDDPDYETSWEVYQEQRKNEAPGCAIPGYYDSFKNLGVALMANVVLALVTSVLQLTLGFVSNPWAVGFCLGFGATTICLLIFLWWQITCNLMKWFEGLEAKRNRLKRGTVSPASSPPPAQP